MKNWLGFWVAVSLLNYRVAIVFCPIKLASAPKLSERKKQ